MGPIRTGLNSQRKRSHRDSNSIVMFLYYFVGMLLFVLTAPFCLLLRKKRFSHRLALRLPERSLEEGNIWVHALSVGEVISAVALIEELSIRYPDASIVVSASTSAGIDIARNELEDKVKAVVTMPVDFLWSVRRIIRFVKPSLFVLVETDLWPGLLDQLSKKRVKSILVNGRVSPRTFRSYRRFPFFIKMMFQMMECCLMQTVLDRERILRVCGASENIVTVGNIKFDRHWEPMDDDEHRKWLDMLGLDSDPLVWVAGSIHAGEAVTVLETFRKLHAVHPNLVLILAPRRINDAEKFRRIALDMGLRSLLRSELSEKTDPYDVLMLNTIGELGRVYGLGHVCFVGGSLVPEGGHNPLEPASFGSPVLFGPHMDDFLVLSELLVEAGGGIRVRNEDELYRSLKSVLENNEIRKETGLRAKRFVENNQGALERVLSYIDRVYT